MKTKIRVKKSVHVCPDAIFYNIACVKYVCTVQFMNCMHETMQSLSIVYIYIYIYIYIW